MHTASPARGRVERCALANHGRPVNLGERRALRPGGEDEGEIGGEGDIDGDGESRRVRAEGRGAFVFDAARHVRAPLLEIGEGVGVGEGEGQS